MSTHAGTRGHGLLEGYLARCRFQRARRLLPADIAAGRVLDLGCGPHPSFLLESGFAEGHGLDKEITAAQQAALPPHLSVQTWDLEQEAPLPYEAGAFDAVTMLAVIEHLPPERVPGLLADIRRVLRPGGTLVLTTPACWTDPLLRVLARLRLVSPVEIEDHKAVYGRRSLLGLLQAAGFAPESLRFGHAQAFTNSWATARRPLSG